MDILSHMLSFVKPTEWEKASLYGNRTERQNNAAATTGLLNAHGTHATVKRNEVVMKFDWGIFDKKLSKFIPLFMLTVEPGTPSTWISICLTAVPRFSIRKPPGTGAMGQIQVESLFGTFSSCAWTRVLHVDLTRWL